MKINNLQQEKILNRYLQQKKSYSPDKKGSKGSKNDSMEISSQARKATRLKAELKNLPEIREKKVAELKARVDSGEYRVDSKLLAQKLLNTFKQEITDDE